MKEPVKIVYTTLKAQIDEGWKMDQLKEHYGLNHSQMKKVLQQANLQIRKFRQPAFILDMGNEGTIEENVKAETLNREEEQKEDSVENLFSVTETTDEVKEEVEDLSELEPISETEKKQKNFWEE